MGYTTGAHLRVCQESHCVLNLVFSNAALLHLSRLSFIIESRHRGLLNIIDTFSPCPALKKETPTMKDARWETPPLPRTPMGKWEPRNTFDNFQQWRMRDSSNRVHDIYPVKRDNGCYYASWTCFDAWPSPEHGLSSWDSFHCQVAAQTWLILPLVRALIRKW